MPPVTAAEYISGAQNTGLMLQAERVIDIPRRIYWQNKDITPLLHITGGKSKKGLPVKKKVAINPEFKVLEKKPHAEFTAINGAGHLAASTNLTVDSTAHIKPHDVLKAVGLDEEVIVLSVTSATVINVKRAAGATAAVDLPDNTPLMTVQSAREEFSPRGSIVMAKNVIRTNYTQIMDFWNGLSRTADKSEYYGGSKGAEMREETWLEWKKRTEKAFLFGEPFEDLDGGPNGNPIRKTGGVIYWIKSGGGYVEQATTTYTRTMWAAWCRNLFENGRQDYKLVLSAPKIIDMLSFWKDEKLQMSPNNYVYDLRVHEWESGHGTLFILRDPMLKDSPAGNGAGYGGCAVAVEPEKLNYRYLTDSDVKYYHNVVKDGSDGKYDVCMGEVGLGINNPEGFGILEEVSTWA